MQDKYITIEGQTLHYVESGLRADNLVTLVFLHGFPESWHTWQNQLAYFSTEFRVIAADLPGYNDSDKPAKPEAYLLPRLIALLAGFIKGVSPDKKVVLVAHDWGGAIAWPLVAFHGHLFEKLVIINAAHPSTFTREMINNPQQRACSDYIHQLIEGNAEEMVSRDDFAFLKSMLTDHSGSSVLADEIMQIYQANWAKPGVLTGMLNYYRAMPQLAPRESQSSRPVVDVSLPKMKIPNIQIKVPTLVLWGLNDKAFVASVLDGLDEYVEQLKVVRFADASHWLHHEQPEAVNREIKGFI